MNWKNDQLPNVYFDENAKLFALDQSRFYLPFITEKRYKIDPSMEVGWATPEGTAISNQLYTEGVFNCSEAISAKYDFVIDAQWLPQGSPCLSLIWTNGSWRVWKVLNFNQ